MRLSQLFVNPLLKHGADPYAIRHRGKYYVMVTEGDQIGLRQTSDITNLEEADYRVLWEPAVNTPSARDIWAPELHQIDGKWFIYFTATSDDGADENRRIFVLRHEGSSENPFDGQWTYAGPLTLPVDRYAIDGTVLFDKDQYYFLWSSKLPLRGGWWQHIMIAAMHSPTELVGPEVVLSVPEYEWECDLMPVNEGPQILKKGSDIFVAYSGSAYWSPNYQLGMLRAQSGANLLSPSSWTKSKHPLFSQDEERAVYGPGHNSFIMSPDGQENWILYHAWSEKPGPGVADSRSPRLQPFGWEKDGWPLFGAPIPAHQYLNKPSGT